MPKFLYEHCIVAKSKLFAVIAAIVLIAGVADAAGAGRSSMAPGVISEREMFLAPRAATQILPDSDQPDGRLNVNIAPNAAITPLVWTPPFSYLTVAGSVFASLSSSTTIEYATMGCVYTNGGSLNARLDLPEGATIVYIRVYFYDTDAANDLNVSLRRYDLLNSSYTDITSVGSTGSAGSGTELSFPAEEPVDNYLYTYQLLANTPNSANVLFCGVRVAYYPPFSLTIY